MESNDVFEINRGGNQLPLDNTTLQGMFRSLEMHSFETGDDFCSSGWGTDEGVEQELRQYLNDVAHIIPPALSSKESPLEPISATIRDEGLMKYGEQIAGYIGGDGEHHRNGILYRDDGELKKPIVMIINTHTVRADLPTDTAMVSGLHWVTLIILPTEYKVLGEVFPSSSERAFYFDSFNLGAKLPDAFKTLLKDGEKFQFEESPGALEEQSDNEDIIDHDREIPAAFPEIKFIEEMTMGGRQYGRQQMGGSDCAWWAVYNAIMVVCTGGNEFLKQFQGVSPSRASILRELFVHLTENEVTRDGTHENFLSMTRGSSGISSAASGQSDPIISKFEDCTESDNRAGTFRHRMVIDSEYEN